MSAVEDLAKLIHTINPFDDEYEAAQRIIDAGWRPPELQLPTERGLYVDNGGDAWILDRDDKWLALTNGGRRMFDGETDNIKPSVYLPFTRLVPEGEK